MMRVASAPRLSLHATGELKHRLVKLIGGRGRAKIVVLFASVLALESADLATIGSAGPQLESSLRISSTELGLLAAISTFFSAVMTLPFGALVDRVNRVRLLALGVATWAVVMVVSAAAQSYDWLLLSRLGLGAVTAVAYPGIASLTGDFFPAGERGRIYGYILAGELLGTGFGFVVSGAIASAFSWRWAFGVLALPAVLLAAVLWTRLAEPARGRQASAEDESGADQSGERGEGEEQGLARRVVAAGRAEPVEELVLRRSPSRMGMWRAMRYVLSIRTNRSLIVASAIGYLFFAGLRTFGVVFVRGHFSVPQGTAIAILFVAGLGSLAGVLVAGRLADRLISPARPDARIVLGGFAYLLAAIVLLPGILLKSVAAAIPFLIVAGAGLSAPNPPLDAARLDIMPSALWGRAEAVRVFLRQAATAVSPPLFGLVADALGPGGAATLGGSSQHVSAGAARGLEYAFLIMLVPLAINGLVLLFRSRRTYPADVATAAASEQAIRSHSGDQGEPGRRHLKARSGESHRPLKAPRRRETEPI